MGRPQCLGIPPSSSTNDCHMGRSHPAYPPTCRLPVHAVSPFALRAMMAGSEDGAASHNANSSCESPRASRNVRGSCPSCHASTASATPSAEACPDRHRSMNVGTDIATSLCVDVSTPATSRPISLMKPHRKRQSLSPIMSTVLNPVRLSPSAEWGLFFVFLFSFSCAPWDISYYGLTIAMPHARYIMNIKNV